MKIVVDTNIVFSAILNSNSEIGDLLVNSGKYIEFYSVDYLRYEISKHYDRLSKLSKQPIDKIIRTEYYITKGIKFISEEQITENNWRLALNLVKDIDLDDIAFVALSRQLRCKLWTGDKVLITGLFNKGFKSTIQTKKLLQYRAEMEQK